MLGKTHMSVGAATALALLQPSTVSGCVCAVAGGVVGGWICDIDVRSHPAIGGDADSEDEEEAKAYDDERWQILVFVLIITAICFAIDCFVGNGMCAYISSHLGVPMIVAGVMIAALCAYGIASAHRTVMHSIAGGVILGASIYVLCAPLAPAFVLGYASHVLLDLFNRRRIQLFWPLKRGVMFGICSSNGVANKVIGAIGLIACLVLLAAFLVPSVYINEYFGGLFQGASEFIMPFEGFVLTNFQLYLLAINVITFLVYLVDYFAWSRGAYGDNPEVDRQDFVHTIFLLLPAAGGALGMLVAVLIGTRGKLVRGDDGNIGFYTHGLCFLVVWVCIYFIACNPFGIELESNSTALFLKEHHVILVLFATLNIIAFIVFLLDGKQYRKANVKEIGEFALAFIGGATGAYLAMVLSNHKMNTAAFGQAAPLMMAMHYVLLSIAYFNGYL